MDVVSPRAHRAWTVASLVANQVIIVTGAVVRVTDSGLGCPTWPTCTPDSYVPQAALGLHGVIEFGNRLLTFVLAAIALATFLVARSLHRRGLMPRKLVTISFGVGLGIIGQAIVGGLSVLARLNPWVVGLHMVLSMVLVTLCVWMIHLAYGRTPMPSTGAARIATRLTVGLGIAVIAVGVVTTGAGPNSGDGAATRNGLPLDSMAKAHAWVAWALVAATILALVLLWRTAARRAVALLLAIELLQGLVGYVQYFTHLPMGLVVTHMLGTALFGAALAHLYFTTLAPPTALGSPDQRVDGSGGEHQSQVGVGQVEEPHRA
jgi:cytochrome c oxidase assembly protein subunit 15